MSDDPALQVSAFLEAHGPTTEAALAANAWWRLKHYLRTTLGSSLAATRTRTHFVVNNGPPRPLARVVEDANAEAKRRGDPLFDLAEVERGWASWKTNGRGG